MAIAAWPLREMLLSYLARVREELEESFRHAQLLYQVRNVFGGKEEPPVPPALIRETSKR